jgi:hypothetical protein
VIGSVGGTMYFCFESKNKPREKMYMLAYTLDIGRRFVVGHDESER